MEAPKKFLMFQENVNWKKKNYISENGTFRVTKIKK